MGAKDFAVPAVAAVLAVLAAAGWNASQAAPAAPPAGAKATVYNDYHPNLSDMMTMLIQPRHIKLGLGIRTRNWAYAAYEANELRGAFRRVVASMPTYQGQDTAELVALIGKPLDDMQAAARSQDPAKAEAAYADLTNACNVCHAAQGRTYIVIQAPAAAMFPDQDFSAR